MDRHALLGVRLLLEETAVDVVEGHMLCSEVNILQPAINPNLTSP